MSDARLRILVTGGAGFVGSHLADALVADGHTVTILDNLSSGKCENVPQQAQFVHGDVRDAARLHDLVTQADACFHLAAIASVPLCQQDWLGIHQTNQSAFVGLLEQIARRRDGPFPVVYASSAAVYGDAKSALVAEDEPLSPLSLYGADKAGCERVAAVAGHAGVPSFGLRPFNIYGPRQVPRSPYSGVITIFAERLRRNERLTVFGDGQQTRDFIHVADIVAMLRAGLANASTEAPVCNAATGRATTINDLAQTMAGLFGTQAQIDYQPPRPGDIRHSVGDATRSGAMLGIRATTELATGLRFVLDSAAATA